MRYLHVQCAVKCVIIVYENATDTCGWFSSSSAAICLQWPRGDDAQGRQALWRVGTQGRTQHLRHVPGEGCLLGSLGSVLPSRMQEWVQDAV